MGGVAGGISRDVLLMQIPAPLLNPMYLVLTILAALLAMRIEYNAGQKFREGLFQFATSLSLPWYAVIGAGKALDAGLPLLTAVVIGVVGATAGRFIIDLTCGVTPKQFIRGEWFVGTAVLASVVYVACFAWLHWGVWSSTLAAFTVAFVFRYTAMLRGWEEPEPWMPPELAVETPRPAIQDQLRKEFGDS
ncbi:putative membrane protein YeiH [Allocatelliglobosispora scoriae]|uniref:Putative membrane protein YeiH n=1 Tax=Allocatelliglobosispora scoriae TaxID=643052 RepID=A0A841BHS6_9ACTN|nr:putative membrane protein YeiH [Allocatelliglobosispora scoriae]